MGPCIASVETVWVFNLGGASSSKKDIFTYIIKLINMSNFVLSDYDG